MEGHSHPKTALPLLGLLVLASVLGIAVAVMLAAVTMLLAAPAYADEGRLLLERRHGLAQATLIFSECEAHADGSTRLVEAYHNPFDEPLGGLYVVRLPDEAVLESLRIAGDAIGPAYAVLRRRNARALVEHTGEIGPGETLVVELEYRRRQPGRLLAL